MIKATTTSKNIIEYTCDCGAVGECMFKSPNESTVIILDLKCPMCEYVERLKLIKYNSEENKTELLKEDADLYWAIVVDNRLKGD